MQPEKFQSTDEAELLAEELTEREVRELLERLGSQQLGGSENATVAAVVEATGASAIEVGRLLADIRKEHFERRFGLRLNEHEQRIQRLEEEEKSTRSDEPRWQDRYVEQENSSHYFEQYHRGSVLDDIVRREEMRRRFLPWSIAVFILILILSYVSRQSAAMERERDRFIPPREQPLIPR